MPSVEVRLLGGFSVVTIAPVRFPARKTESLFAYLLMSGQPVGRNRLAGTFWPDVVEERARRSLSTALWRLKSLMQSIPEIRIETSGVSVRLRCDTADVDVFHFRSLVESLPSLDGQSRERALREAEDLYKGDFLDGFTDEWCEDERRCLRALYGRLLRQLIEASRVSGQFDKGVSYARKLVELDSLDEESHRELMILYHLSGDRSAALVQFETLKRILQDELDIPPSPATAKLHKYIRSRTEGRSSLDARGAESPRYVGAENFSGTPMIGREACFGDLMRVVDGTVRGLGSAVVVSGEAGIGKARLAESVAAEAGMRGFDVLQGRCRDLKDPPPYHDFIQALWPRISLADKPGGEASSALSTLLQALAPNPSSDAADTERRMRQRFYDSAIVNEALLNLLGKNQHDRPTLLILEDIHGIDKASTTLLVTLLGRLLKTKLSVLLTMRSGGDAKAEILSQLIANGASEIRLEPLEERGIEMLVRTALRAKSLPSAFVLYVRERTNGIPLFVWELLKCLQGEGLLKRDPLLGWAVDQRALNQAVIKVPSRVQEVIRQRIQGLDSEARKILCAAAVMGAEVEFNQLRELVGAPDERFIEDTDRLVGAQLLQETKTGFRFPHESMRLVALSVIKKRTLQPLHRRVADLVLRSAPGRTEDLAWHYEEAGDLVRALRYAEASADKARVVYANSDAVTWYTRALELLFAMDSQDETMEEALRRRSTLLRKRYEVLDLLGDRRGQSADIDAIQMIAGRLDDPRLQAEALYMRANLLIRMNADQEALADIRQAVKLFRAIKAMQSEARSYETAGLIYINLRRYSLASAEFRRALRLFRQSGDRAGQARGLVHLGMLLGFETKSVAAVKSLDRADVLLRELEDHRLRAIVKFQQGILYRYEGQLKLSESRILSGLSIMTQIGDRVGMARGLVHLAYTHATMGRLRDAIHEGEGALRIAREAKDIRAKILILNNSAYGVHRIVGNFTRAERYITEAMKLVAEAGGAESVAPYTDTMAAILLDRGDFYAALSWAERGEAMDEAFGVKSWIELEIDYTLGSVCLELGQCARSARYLRSAQRQYARGQELAFETLATAALARLHLITGDLDNALKSARAVSNLLRKVDGVEQIQKVFWSQYLVFRAAGSHAAARRALRQAYTSVLQQASMLKGRYKRVFLHDVKINREIFEEVGRNQSVFHRGLGLPATAKLIAFRAGEFDSKGRYEGSPQGKFFRDELTTRRSGIEDRRRTITNLLEREQLTQLQIAEALGVSLRTVRNDLAALRSQGLTPKST